MIKNLIFDFDGVLVDSEILVGKAFSKYLQSLGFNFNEKDFYKYAGKKTIQVVSDLSDKYFIKDKEKFYKDIMSISLEIYSNDLTIIPGAYEYIEKSKRNLFIGSNSIKLRILKGLKKVQLDKFFNKSKIFSFDMVKNPKPYPDIYIKVIESNQLEKKETVIIEDSPVGVQAGIAAGINVIGITAGSHWTQNRSDKQLIDSGAIHVISNFKYLDKILKDL